MTEPPSPTASQLRAAAAICSTSKAAGGPRLADILDAWARRLEQKGESHGCDAVAAREDDAPEPILAGRLDGASDPTTNLTRPGGAGL